jgi:cytochrome P450
MTKPQLDPYEHAFHLDPYPRYRAIREEDPVHFVQDRGFWLLTTWNDVRNAFRDFKTFSSANLVALEANAEAELPYPAFINSDPPHHTEVRRLFSPLMTPEALAPFESYIRERTRELMAPHLPAGKMDIVGDVACYLPMDVISVMTGIPQQDRDNVRGWADDLILREDKQEGLSQRNIEGYLNLAGYFEEFTRTVADDPGGHRLLSVILNAEKDGVMTHPEVIGALILMAIAGNETTTKLIGNITYRLWEHPEQRQMVIDDPRLVADAVEETLRLDGSSQVIARRVAKDVELEGKTLLAGDKVGLCIISANRDKSRCPMGENFDITKATRDHMAFGFGLHSCLGAALARLEARVVMEEIILNMPDYEILTAGLEMAHNPNVRGYSRLPVSFTPRNVSTAAQAA